MRRSGIDSAFAIAQDALRTCSGGASWTTAEPRYHPHTLVRNGDETVTALGACARQTRGSRRHARAGRHARAADTRERTTRVRGGRLSEGRETGRTGGGGRVLVRPLADRTARVARRGLRGRPRGARAHLRQRQQNAGCAATRVPSRCGAAEDHGADCGRRLRFGAPRRGRGRSLPRPARAARVPRRHGPAPLEGARRDQIRFSDPQPAPTAAAPHTAPCHPPSCSYAPDPPRNCAETAPKLRLSRARHAPISRCARTP